MLQILLCCKLLELDGTKLSANDAKSVVSSESDGNGCSPTHFSFCWMPCGG